MSCKRIAAGSILVLALAKGWQLFVFTEALAAASAPSCASSSILMALPNAMGPLPECEVQCGHAPPANTHIAAVLVEALRAMQASAKTLGIASPSAPFPVVELGLISSGLLDGIRDASTPLQQAFFTRSGLGGPVSEASDYLLCKMKDFFGSYFAPQWGSDLVAASHAEFTEQWLEWNQTLAIRRCLNQSDRGGDRRSTECFRVTDQSFPSAECQEHTQQHVDAGARDCALPLLEGAASAADGKAGATGARADLVCPSSPQRGVCGGNVTHRRCYNVFSMADLGEYACPAWRSSSARLQAWPSTGGLEGAALYARAAVFSLSLAHSTLLTGALNQLAIDEIRRELRAHALWMTARIGEFQNASRQRELILATSTRSGARIDDYLDSYKDMHYGGLKVYTYCGDFKAPDRQYRHFLGYGCPPRAGGPAYADLPRFAVVGFVQANDKTTWCESAVNCSALASPTPTLPRCKAWRVVYNSGYFATAPYMSDIHDGSACRALFSGLKTGDHWPDECNSMKFWPPTDRPAALLLNDVSDPLNCTYLASHCQNYMDLLWEAQEKNVMTRLSSLVSEMLRDYTDVAELFSALATTNYTQIAGLAQKNQVWPAVPT
jgi:hypothetical protein